ncbi:MAG: lipoyl(octanoyl) transferase LipB [Candidatus Omnitrophica bacterium]|nr:lipoyl(octanoyl) transferase LipB [Candidatus Omnitrophota bacterium]
MATNTQNICEAQDLGLIDYAASYGIQKECVARVLAGGAQVLLLCEHPAVITLGRLAQEANILNLEAINRQGIRVVPIDRGGDVTLHAPGQLVVYPILNLAPCPPVPRSGTYSAGRQGSRDLRLYMHKLEQVTIALLKSFDIVASRFSGKTGVFVGPDKIVSLGIGVRKWVTYHGLGLNVNTDLKLFELIKPCGLDVRMTSIARIKGNPVDMSRVKQQLVECFKKGFGYEFCYTA